jgi:thiol-disulfide isomerase/thioredoxin
VNPRSLGEQLDREYESDNGKEESIMAKKRRPTNKPRGDVSRVPSAEPTDRSEASGTRSSNPPDSPGASGKPIRSNGMNRRAAEQAARNRSKRIRVGLVSGIGVLVLAGAILLAFAGGSPTAGDSTTTAAWVLPRLGQSGTVSLASLRGKPVVVNMFASWCTTCQAELPAFTAAARRLKGKVTFVEVNSLETGSGQGMAQQFGLGQAGAVVLSDVGGAQNSGLHDALGGGNNMPVSAFYGASGQLLTSHVGGFTAITLQSELQQLYGTTA